MTPTLRNGDDQLAAILEQCDAALAAGADPGPAVAAAPEALRPRLRRAQECLRLLEEVWPRDRPARPAVADPTHALPPGTSFVVGDLGVPQRLGRFEVLGELGRGGCGVVCLAYDPVLGRRVALKVPRPGALVTPELRRRFLREAHTAAELDHPNLVPVYEAGEVGPICYIAAAYCEGPSLDRWLREHGPLASPRAAAALLAELAGAVQYMHERGIVHRDIKPSNLLLAPAPGDGPAARARPDDAPEFLLRLTDFGLAKLRDHGPDETPSGAVLGTPLAMAPEQARGRRAEVGPPTDVYALGVILYALLTGHPPFQGGSDLEVLHRLLTEEPDGLRLLRPDVPRDLEAICLKCLEKRPERRYASAAALAADLRRFLAGEPTRARPLGPLGRGLKWTRRRPTAAALLAVSLVGSASLVGLGLWHTAQLAAALDAAERHRLDAEAKAEHNRHLVYASNLRAGHYASLITDMRRVGASLDLRDLGDGPEDPRDFEWYYLWKLAHSERSALVGHDEAVYAVAFGPDGRTVATGGQDGTARLWDAADGRCLAVLADHDGEVNHVALSPDGATLATSGDDGTIRLYDVPSGRPRARLTGHEGPVFGLAFSTDGATLASGGKDRTVRLWDLASGRSVALRGHDDAVEAVAFGPGGRAVVSASSDGTARRWDLAAGPLAAGNAPSKVVARHEGRIFAVAISPDGRTLATGGQDRMVRLWDARTGAPRASLGGHADWVTAVAFSPDGREVASGGNDTGIRIWSVAGRHQLRTFKGHLGRVWNVAFSPDGRTLASAGGDRVVKLWDAALHQEGLPLPPHPAEVRTLGFSPDGRTLATGGDDGVLRLFSVPAGGPATAALAGHHGGIWSLAFAPKSRAVATIGVDATLRLWDLDASRPRWTLPVAGPSYAVAFTPDGRTIAAGLHTGVVTLVDAETGRPLGALPGDEEVLSLCFSADGAGLAVATVRGGLMFWDVRARRLVRTLRNPGMIHGVTFCHRGRIVAAACDNSMVRIWEAATGAERPALLGHVRAVRAVALSAGGRTFATGSDDQSVKLWNVKTGQEMMDLRGHTGRISTVAFSPDGRTLATAGRTNDGKGEVRLWFAAAPEDVPPIPIARPGPE